MRLFNMVTWEEVKRGDVTDIYFERTEEILRRKGLYDTWVAAEIVSHKLPNNWSWAVLAGVEDVCKLLEGLSVDFYSLPEGTVFRREVPVARVEGPYGVFCRYETAILGMLCQASGVATAAARVKLAAEGKPVYSFGVRRMHPAVSLVVERAAIIGGCDGGSLKLLSELGLKPVGTMPHALILVFGDQRGAWKAFDDVMPSDVPRIALVDTFYDEKVEAVMAADLLKEKLFAVRLDTPSSRRGSMEDIVREVRWELDLRGYRHVKIFVSGGLNEESVAKLAEAGADAFGVGTYISNAKTVDFSMDIVEVEGRPVAKRGKPAGRKDVFYCSSCMESMVLAAGSPKPRCPSCGELMENKMVKHVERGRAIAPKRSVLEIRSYVLEQLSRLTRRLQSRSQ